MSANLSNDVFEQRDYYERTAEQYDAMHVKADDEHGKALNAFMGLADVFGSVESILDVGAGTGRAIKMLKDRWPTIRVLGVEPVGALRDIGHRKGIPPAELIFGDALCLDFDDNSFDYVIETGMLHHVARPALAIKEMTRVARKGIMISDVNNIAVGGRAIRLLKYAIKRLGLWPCLVWVQTRGRMYKVDEGDGIFYSFSIFDYTNCFRHKFPTMHFMNTVSCNGFNLSRDAGGVMIFATQEDSPGCVRRSH